MTDYEQFLEENGLTEADCEREKEDIDFLPFTKLERGYFRRGPSRIAGDGIFARVDLDPIYISAYVYDRWTEVGRYMNHSPYPTCQVARVGGGLVFFTSNVVPTGTELTVNYRDVKKAMNETTNRRDCVSSAA